MTDTFPYKRLQFANSDALIKKFHKLCEISSQNCVKYNAKEKTLIFDSKYYKEFCELADYFTEPVRIRARIYDFVSPHEYWMQHSDAVREHAIKMYSIAQTTQVDAVQLRESIWMQTKEATSFNIPLAKRIYDLFLPSLVGQEQRKYSVLDPFSGWGDRAIAALACNQIQSYDGVDCNLDLKGGYEEISNLLDVTLSKNSTTSTNSTSNSMLVNIKKIKWHLETIQSFLKSNSQMFDLIFTSPPYFDYECYTSVEKLAELQSHYKMNRYEQWLREFWTPVLLDLVKILKQDAFFVLHIGSTKRTPTMAPDTVTLLENLQTIRYCGKIDCYNNKKKRPIPIWIFQKC